MDKLLIITGQTACGKTDLAFRLAEKYDGEIVSFDSRQAYKNLNIITGKDIDPRIKTWMIDVYDPKQIITAYDYCQKANAIISDIIKRNKLPIIVGGTVFYIKSFLDGVSDFEGEPNWDLRNELEKYSVAELQNILRKINIERLSQMNNSDINNKRRLIRAIEIFKYQKSNIPTSLKLPPFAQGFGVAKRGAGMKNGKKSIILKKYDSLIIGLWREKEDLVKIIEKRVKKRIDSGAFEEIDDLLKSGYSFSDPGLNTIGYKQLKEFYEGKKMKDEVILDWEKQEIDYARRQLVFMKKLAGCNIFKLSGSAELEKIEELVYKWQYAKS